MRRYIPQFILYNRRGSTRSLLRMARTLVYDLGFRPSQRSIFFSVSRATIEAMRTGMADWANTQKLIEAQENNSNAEDQESGPP